MILILVILLVICFIITCINVSEDDFTNSIFGALGTSLSILALMIYITDPKPIDVYRNKTTLQVTYKDSIAVDSVVVFK